ncbi:TetR-like C-terminal domain-containing protein [Cohnella sp. AR92]|uniref:TetR-like C-terminal domain-containing protein n=1 Tax=Cohnella sp. AR92 TaxID=648716 RepID=UPI000F8EC6A8|nr:TetR-like C-terminal domain-containing protein [Cohnella sp. AR92]RUS47844.1 TetR/AcrR family transcriptional regulator [Cohnella sp. AR92]
MSPRIGLDLPTLLEAATELADQQGLESVTLASLASQLNIRSPSLYNHVNGLPELRRLLALKGLELLLTKLDGAAANLLGDEALMAFCRAYLSFSREHPGLYEAFQRAPEPDDTELKQAAALVVDRAVQAIGAYGLQGDAAIHAVRAVRSFLHGFASLERQGGFGIKLDLDDTFRLMVETFIAGVKARRNEASEGVPT